MDQSLYQMNCGLYCPSLTAQQEYDLWQEQSFVLYMVYVWPCFELQCVYIRLGWFYTSAQKQFLDQRKVTVLYYPPYSPDSTCWLLFVPKSEKPLEGASLLPDFGHPESRDKYIKHHCKGRFLQRHPEAVWPCKSVCTVRRDVCRKPTNKSVISFTQIPFIMPVLKLNRRTAYVDVGSMSHQYGFSKMEQQPTQLGHQWVFYGKCFHNTSFPVAAMFHG